MVKLESQILIVINRWFIFHVMTDVPSLNTCTLFHVSLFLWSIHSSLCLICFCPISKVSRYLNRIPSEEPSLMYLPTTPSQRQVLQHAPSWCPLHRPHCRSTSHWFDYYLPMCPPRMLNSWDRKWVLFTPVSIGRGIAPGTSHAQPVFFEWIKSTLHSYFLLCSGV